MKNNRILLRTLLLSTSQRNIFRHTKDKKKRKKVIGNYIGMSVLYIMIMAYSISMCIGYGEMGMIDSAPVMCALTVSTIAFVFGLFKTNGYLFNFKEYDMLMALPFEVKTVAACKFLYMYIKSLPWYLGISVAMLTGYAYYKCPAVYVYPVWFVLAFFLPVIPMLVAAFIGFIIAKISSGFRKTNIVQTVILFAVVIFCFSIRFIIEDIFRNDKVEQTLESISAATDDASGIYLPAGWFEGAVTECRISDMLLLAGLSVLLFSVIFYIVGRSYRNINSALKSHAAAKSFRMSTQKKRSVVQSIAYKEFKRMTGSSTYMVNGGLGMVLAPLIGILTFFVGFDNIVELVTQGAPIDSSVLQPAIPFIIYFFTGMLSTTACSPSLEGKNYWIIQSLPIDKRTVYKGKMLFNMYLTVPSMIFSVLCLCISARVPVLDSVLYLVLGIMLCAFSTAWGCVCGIRFMRLDWENEVEVIKQGAAATLYLLPNMFVVMGLIVLVVILGMYMDSNILTLILIAVTALLTGISYIRAMALAKRT